MNGTRTAERPTYRIGGSSSAPVVKDTSTRLSSTVNSPSGLVMAFEITTRNATATGKRRRHASSAIAPTATTYS